MSDNKKVEEFKRYFKFDVSRLAPELDVLDWEQADEEVASVAISGIPQQAVPYFNATALNKCSSIELKKIAFEEAMHCGLFPLTREMEKYFSDKYIVTLEHQVIHKLYNLLKDKDFKI